MADMLLDGNFSVMEDSPIFERGATTGNLVCTRVAYTLLSGEGERTWVHTPELCGASKAVMEQYVSRMAVGKGSEQGMTGTGTNRARKANGKTAPSTRYDVEFEVELGAVHPEIYECFSDGHRATYAVSRADASVVTLYRPDGRAVEAKSEGIGSSHYELGSTR